MDFSTKLVHTGKEAAPKYAQMRPASEINIALAALPTAEAVSIYERQYDFDAQEISYAPVGGFCGVKVTLHDQKHEGEKVFVNCPTTQYRVVQHEAAFRPIIEGLTQTGTSDFRFIVRENAERAELRVFAGAESADSVVLGFVVRNSYDGSQILSYGFSKLKETQFLEVVGYRQVCSNGMKIRVPLKDAEIIRNEVVHEVKVLFEKALRIRHTASAENRIEEVQYIVEAMALLREPVAAVIRKAQAWSIKDEETLARLIEQHVGKRKAARVLEQYAREPGTSLWDLYNAVTYVSSHDPEMRLVTSDRLEDKAANMLWVELQTPEVAR